MCIYLGRYTHIYFLFLLRNPGSSDTTIEKSTPSAKIWFLIPFSNQKKLPGEMTEFSSGSRKIHCLEHFIEPEMKKLLRN